MRRLVVVTSLAVLSTGCWRRVPQDTTRDMEQLGSRLTYLTASIQAALLEGTVPDAARDREIVAAATRHDPALARPFDGYVVRVARRQADALVLVCTEDGGAALLEDATCTPGLDAHRWEATPRAPCEFTLGATVCAR